MSLTISIPVYENSSRVLQFVIGNAEILERYDVIVVNRSGGEELKDFAFKYVELGTAFWIARKYALNYIKSKYVLNLDADTILPDGYIEKAIELLEKCSNIGMVNINYQKPYTQNHGAFGTSIMRVEDMKKLYDYSPLDYPNCICECKYMEDKVLKAGMSTVTLEFQALHLKGKM
jgi:cellulose synthase/poly-beta-1,6-N-acetylglucosamine synthase-like glycosyltransferase